MMSEVQDQPSKASSKSGDPTKREKLQLDPEEYQLRKRLPKRFPSRPNDVYVNNRTDFKAQLARAFKTLETDDCVYIHGLGAAVSRAVNLALQLQEKSSIPLETCVNTSTVNLIDDFEPQTDEGLFHTGERQNSAVHIKVFKVNTLKTDTP